MDTTTETSNPTVKERISSRIVLATIKDANNSIDFYKTHEVVGSQKLISFQLNRLSRNLTFFTDYKHLLSDLAESDKATLKKAFTNLINEDSVFENLDQIPLIMSEEAERDQFVEALVSTNKDKFFKKTNFDYFTLAFDNEAKYAELMQNLYEEMENKPVLTSLFYTYDGQLTAAYSWMIPYIAEEVRQDPSLYMSSAFKYLKPYLPNYETTMQRVDAYVLNNLTMKLTSEEELDESVIHKNYALLNHFLSRSEVIASPVLENSLNLLFERSEFTKLLDPTLVPSAKAAFQGADIKEKLALIIHLERLLRGKIYTYLDSYGLTFKNLQDAMDKVFNGEVIEFMAGNQDTYRLLLASAVLHKGFDQLTDKTKQLLDIQFDDSQLQAVMPTNIWSLCEATEPRFEESLQLGMLLKINDFLAFKARGKEAALATESRATQNSTFIKGVLYVPTEQLQKDLIAQYLAGGTVDVKLDSGEFFIMREARQANASDFDGLMRSLLKLSGNIPTEVLIKQGRFRRKKLTRKEAYEKYKESISEYA